MNAQRLLDQFDRISEAPDAVPRLRRFILDLAVRGKLVEQDPKDEPTAELLKRIQAEKAGLVNSGKIKKQELPTMDSASTPFAVPKHWVWLQLSGIGVLSGGMTPSKNRPEFWEGDINWFSPKDIKSDELVDSELKITPAGVAETGLQLYPPGCLFMVARSGILKRTFPVSINRVEATANQDMKVLTPFLDGLERYLQIMFRGMTHFILSTLVKTGTTVQSLKYEEFESQPFPLPPLAEQRRIVVKVEELMVLCDRLEAAQAERETRRDRLVAASLQRLNNGADADAFREHARFHLRHLPRLTARPEHIQQLRQAILSVAVRGRLVSQDPNDEPASDLLATVAAQKKKAGGARTGRDWVGDVGKAVEAAFAPPHGWTWTRIANAVERVTVGYVGPMKSQYVEDGIPFLRSQNVRASLFRKDGLISISPQFHHTIAKSALAPGDVVVVRSGNVGTSCVIPRSIPEANCSDLVVVKNPSAVLSEYLCFYLNSIAATHIVAGTVGVALTHFNTKSVARMPLPLPPLAEQRRVVAKVDELMAICDRLETQLVMASAGTDRLLETLLQRAMIPV